jgi:cardiolipin synthase C
LRYKLLILLLLIILSCGIHANENIHAVSKKSHTVQILEHGKSSLLKRIQLIRSAKKSIKLEYFIFRPDLSGKLLLLELIKKAEEGVKVQILIDKNPLAPTLNEYLIHVLKENKIIVKYYNPIIITNIDELSYRNHRKLLIVDNKEFITGGRNIGNEYFDFGKKFTFIDRDILVKGPITTTVTNSFNIFWNYKKNITPKIPKTRSKHLLRNLPRSERDKEERKKRLIKIRLQEANNFILTTKESNNFLEVITRLGLNQLSTTQTYDCRNAEFISDSPGKRETSRYFSNTLFEILKDAKYSILIETPYFITIRDHNSLFNHLLDSNLDVSLVTNSLYSNNHGLVAGAFHPSIGKWVKKGLTTYIYKGDIPDSSYDDETKSLKQRWGIHSKSLIIDDNTIMVGTYNFDPISHNTNAENGFFCHDNKSLAQELKNHIEGHIENSLELNEKGAPVDGSTIFFKTSFIEKFLYIIRFLPANLFRSLL